MSVLVDAARLIANLGVLGQEFVGVDSPNFSGEYLAATASSMTGDGLAATATAGKMIGPRLYRSQLDRMTGGLMTDHNAARYKAAENVGKSTDLILWTLTAVEIMELTTGFGPPTEGDALTDGSQEFVALNGQLDSARPNTDGWEGTASEAYADLNKALQTLAQTMANLDVELAALVSDQAEWVTHMRLGFGILKNLLIAAYAIEWAIKLLVPAPGNLAAAQTFAVTVSLLGTGIAAGMLANLTTWSILNGKKANDLAEKYMEAAEATAQQGTSASAKVASACASTVGSFDTAAGGTSGMSAFSGIPTVAALAGLAPTEGVSAEDLAVLSAFNADAPSTTSPLPETPGTPEFTPPTTAQIAQASSQAAKVSAHASQHMNLVNQTMGQAQQLAQTGQQSQAAEEDAPAEDEAAGAATGAQGAERAPIEATAGAQPAEQPSHTQRVI